MGEGASCCDPEEIVRGDGASRLFSDRAHDLGAGGLFPIADAVDAASIQSNQCRKVCITDLVVGEIGL